MKDNRFGMCSLDIQRRVLNDVHKPSFYLITFFLFYYFFFRCLSECVPFYH